MNIMDTETRFDQTKPHFGYITEFKEKNDYEVEVNTAWRRAEPDCVEHLLEHSQISEQLNQRIYDLAFDLAHSLRERKSSNGKAGIVQGLLQEFSLSSQEGIALMCLAEALLRIPDSATRDLLIRDKINQGNWKEHVGQSSLMFVNAAAWGLMLTGKLMETPKQKTLSSVLTGLLARSGRGIIRKAVDVAMRMMGEQFVTGETIQEALEHAEPLEDKGFRYSYDMLGEAALTEHDAERYFQDYSNAIHAIGQASKDKDVYDGPGISIKLSALHPRYQRAQIHRVHEELYPKVLQLAELAKRYNIGLNIDAEESERLEISLELLERLCFEPGLADWKGIGFVIQAYQKRCFYVVDYVVDLATRSQKRLMIRLVKGAYWDSEIKKAQIEGMTDYPVFTRKVHTDLSYIACAKKLLAAPEQIYPQFATHNAQTLATIYHLADPNQYYSGQYEFQCLHGMGEPLYEQVVGNKTDNKLGVPCRIYAPVGNHETLLAYLVRRLLENGANTSFVNRIADKSLKIEDLIENPHAEILKNAAKESQVGQKHPAIPLAPDLYGDIRPNSAGLDLANDHDLTDLNQTAHNLSQQQWQAQVLGKNLGLENDSNDASSQSLLIVNPADHLDIVGHVQEASADQVNQALDHAVNAQAEWSNTAKDTRAAYLQRAADIMQSRMQELMILLCRESGKTYANAIAEVREAVDFLRYYAAQMIDLDRDTVIQPLGTVLCISPWNFPLAIFTGHPIPLIAETGGQNAMIVDSSALTEQVILDVVSSAYDSAGQRCSALRVLCVQEDNADSVIHMLKGAMQQLRVGNPALLKTDIGPVIDLEAQSNIQKHIDQMRCKGHSVHQLMLNPEQDQSLAQGTFIPPTLIELPNLDDLQREVFGPVLHIIRYKYGQLEQLLEQINAKGYGLTMGLHTRIDETIQTVIAHAEVGNLYINRNIVGAVVGVQPFGGEGLSGTGPKAGGPIYLYRLMQHCSAKKLARPFATLAQVTQPAHQPLYEVFYQWAEKTFPQYQLQPCPAFCAGHHYELRGPTGESNQYVVLPRKRVLSLAEQEQDQIQQLAAIFAVGSQPVVLAENTFVLKYLSKMPKEIEQRFAVIQNIESADFDAVLHHGSKAQLQYLQTQIAARSGAIIGITHLKPLDHNIPLERLVIEHAISINTAAAGGNASLMTLN